MVGRREAPTPGERSKIADLINDNYSCPRCLTARCYRDQQEQLTPVIAVSIRKYGLKKTIIFGLVVTFVCLILLGTIITKLWMWIVLWGIAMPVGFAFSGFLPVMTCVMFWFNIRRATVLGIVLTGAAAAGFLAQPTFTWLMEKTNSWESAWLATAALTFVALVCAFFLVGTPQEIGQNPDGLTPEEAAEAAARAEQQLLSLKEYL